MTAPDPIPPAPTWTPNLQNPVDAARCPLGCPLDQNRRGTCAELDDPDAGVYCMQYMAVTCPAARAAAREAAVFLPKEDLHRIAPIPPAPEVKPIEQTLVPIFETAPTDLDGWPLSATDPQQKDDMAEVREHARDLIARYATPRAPQPWLLLVGDAGTGKTQLLRIMGRQAILAGRSCRYVRFTDLVKRVKATRSHDASEREDAVMALFTDVDVLILDDIRPVFNSQDDENIAHAVISYRHGEDLGTNRKATYIATNLSIRELTSIIGVPAMNRVLEDLKPFFCTWPSFRQPADE